MKEIANACPTNEQGTKEPMHVRLTNGEMNERANACPTKEQGNEGKSQCMSD